MRLGVGRLPLRWRLVAATLVGAIGFAVGFGILASWQIDRLEDRGVTGALQARLELVVPQVGTDGSFGRENVSPRTSLTQVIAPNGSVRAATSPLARVPALVDVDDVVEAGSPGVQRTVSLNNEQITVLAVPIRLTASAGSPAGIGAVVVGVDSEGFLSASRQLRSILVLGLGVVVPLAGLLAWLLAGQALRTVSRLTEEAEAVGVSDLGRGLEVPTHDPQLARLGAALNRMLTRVAEGIERERRFSADASHRLRTPLATLRAEAELALDDGDPATMREALGHVIDDADKLTELTNRLLTTSGRGGPDRAEPLVVALEAAADRWRRQTVAAGASFRYAGTEGLVSEAQRRIDPHLLRAVVDPLVENAVQAGGLDADVRVSVVGVDGHLRLDVSDCGPGIAAAVRNRLFQPWTTTRSATGGAGLGLWLSRESARAAGGDVTLADDRPGGTTFTARLPVE